MKRLLREPLLHFLVLGAVIFAVYNSMPKNAGSNPAAIVISRGKLDELAANFYRAWQRTPSDAEMQGLIQDFVREEVAVREAIDMELDRDDTVIRRRLRQKLEFVSETAATQVDPTDADLRTWFTQHADDFRTEPTFSFTQIYLNPQQRGAALAHDAEKLRERLNAANTAIDAASLGDVTALERQFTALQLSEVVQIFGDVFAHNLSTLQPGTWSAPITSSYGTHLVFVSASTPGKTPELAQVRDAVKREWLNEQRVKATDQLYETLLQRYAVRIEAQQAAENIVGSR